MVIKDYAVCIFGELRGVKTTIDSFYKNLIEPIDADIFINCQLTNTHIDDNIKLFNKNYIKKNIYEKPLSSNYFKYNNLLQPINENIIYEGALQAFLNFKEIADAYGDILEKNYNYIILTRSDFKYLFEIPNVLKITKNDNIFWSYEDDTWGGINNNFSIIPSKFIKQYLYSYYNYLTNVNYINKLLSLKTGLNCERLTTSIFKFNNWKIGTMKSNAFITADYINERSTWASIKYNDAYKTLFKYPGQLNNSYKNLNIFNKGNNWKFNGKDKIFLIDEPIKIVNTNIIVYSNNRKIIPINKKTMILINKINILHSNKNKIIINPNKPKNIINSRNINQARNINTLLLLKKSKNRR
jgi:hypothetical protein